MGTKELRKREVWQDVSGVNAAKAENNFYAAFAERFLHRGWDNFEIIAKPKDFAHIYEDIQLDETTLAQIYNPNRQWEHGLEPDYAIRHTKSGKTLYVEVKRQDGWVEGKESSAGRGNAHERSCKFFTPGLLKILREKGRLGNKVLPFWVVFQGDITRDPKHVRAITCWYAEHSAHFFMWRDGAGSPPLLQHFEQHFKTLLEAECK